LPDLLDKISILQLKVERIQEDSCKQELAYLMQQLPEYGFAEAEEFINRLRSVNGRIWDMESDIRKGKEHELGLEEVGRRALGIRNLNKFRIRIKNEIVEKTNKGFKDVKINHGSE
jgi:predicted RNA-binding protein with TRAM domain